MGKICFLIAMIVICIARPFCSTLPWAGSLGIAGFVVTFIYIFHDIRYSVRRSEIVSIKWYSRTLMVLFFIIAILISLLVWNIMKPIPFFQSQMFSDEASFIALILCVYQPIISNVINKKIRGIRKDVH